jgi:glycerophosphoryl diester phosphodiesterase
MANKNLKIAGLLTAFVVAGVVVACSTANHSSSNSDDPKRVFRGLFQPPLIVGHRGAAGYVPEHTLRSYKLALDIGADYIEPDLVMTKDGVLLIRHEPEISMTTNVAEKKEFKKRKTSKIIDGERMTGWFTEDFTLAELKTLRAKERLPFRSHREDGLYQLVTFEEFLQFVRDEEKKRNRVIGIIPEIKHSSYFHGLGFDPEKSLVDLLQKYNFDNEKEPVIIQSLEINNLKRLSHMTKVELVQLIDDPDLAPGDAMVEHRPEHYRDMVTPEALKAIREYATWVSPDKAYIFARDKDGNIHDSTSFVADAHHVGLKVLPWTFRVEPQFLPKNVDAKTEFKMYFEAGVDGVFTDFSDVALVVRKQIYGH